MKRILCLQLMLLLIVISNDSFSNYRKAKNYYQKKNYVRAANEYYLTYLKPANIGEKNKAEIGIALSIEKLGLIFSASKYLSKIVRRGAVRDNPFFRPAMEELGRLNNRISFGPSHIIQLFKSKIRYSDVPGPARGFYFYYLGIEKFLEKSWGKANFYFKKVPSSSSYYIGSLFHIAVISNLAGNHSQSIALFDKVYQLTKNKRKYDEINDLALLNLGRVNYETKRYRESIEYYSQLPRNSELWLTAIWEASWAFFFIEKYNNSLGNIHTILSPFFFDRFYPESYILQAITFLKLCRYNEVVSSMKSFKVRYKPVFRDIRSLLRKYNNNGVGFYKVVDDYVKGKTIKYRGATEILRKISTLDAYKVSRDTIRFSNREISSLKSFRSAWSNSGLYSSIRKFLMLKKSSSIKNSGKRMVELAKNHYSLLLNLSNQTKLIIAEMQLGKIATLRSKISVGSKKEKSLYIGGMQKLSINDSLEYWPFEREYWEDELGYYVYNLNSQCRKKKSK